MCTEAEHTSDCSTAETWAEFLQKQKYDRRTGTDSKGQLDCIK